jgi:hypothetical protein
LIALTVAGVGGVAGYKVFEANKKAQAVRERGIREIGAKEKRLFDSVLSQMKAKFAAQKKGVTSSVEGVD